MRAAVIDDHELIRDSLARVLRDTFAATEVLQAPSLETGLQLLADQGPADLIIVDLNLPGSAGPDSMRAFVEAFPASHVIVISGSDAQEDVIGCLSAGASGFIPKSHSVEEMVAAIRQVCAGGVYVPRALKRRGVEPSARIRRPIVGLENLTRRQREVLDQLLLGRPSRDIARHLDVAEGTVKIHLAAIYRALGVRSRAEAISKLMSP